MNRATLQVTSGSYAFTVFDTEDRKKVISYLEAYSPYLQSFSYRDGGSGDYHFYIMYKEDQSLHFVSFLKVLRHYGCDIFERTIKQE